jgi:hypothetical protein
MLRPLAKNDYDWHPERSARGPDHDGHERRRQGDLCLSQWQPDRAAPGWRSGGRGALGDHVFSLLEGATGSGTRPPGASLDVGDWSRPSFIPIAASTMNGLRFGSRSTLQSLLQNVALLLF